MRRLPLALALLLVAPACDTGEAERPSFRVEVTGDVEATLAGQPRVGTFGEGGETFYTFVLGSGLSTVTLAGVRPRVGTYDPSGSIVVVVNDGVGLFTAREGEVVVESAEGRLVRARFAFDATAGGEDAARVAVEGTMTADLDDGLPPPPLP